MEVAAGAVPVRTQGTTLSLTSAMRCGAQLVDQIERHNAQSPQRNMVPLGTKVFIRAG